MNFALVTTKGKKMNAHKIALASDSVVVKNMLERKAETRREKEIENKNLIQKQREYKEDVESDDNSYEWIP